MPRYPQPSPTELRWVPEKGLLRAFDYDGVSVVSLWPAPYAVRKTREAPRWAHFRPSFVDLAAAGFAEPDPSAASLPLSRVKIASARDILRILRHKPRRPLRDWQNRQALKQLALSVPARVREVILARYRDRFYHLVSFVARVPGALDLCVSNPALAYCWASSWCFKRVPVKRPLRSARAFLRKRQREQLAWLDLPATESARRALAKVDMSPRGMMDLEGLLYLRQALRDPRLLRRVSFLPAINRHVTRVITDPVLEPHAGQTLLMELGTKAMRDDPSDTASNMRDTIQMSREIRPDATDSLVFQSLNHVNRVHHDLVRETRRRGDGRRLAMPIPPPPITAVDIPGVLKVDPLCTGREISDWGWTQHNCIEACYIERVARGGGHCYLYRVAFPERATLFISRGRGGLFHIRDLRAAANAPVRPETLLAVQRWLERVQRTGREAGSDALELWSSGRREPALELA